jgi:hypothetical protein
MTHASDYVVFTAAMAAAGIPTNPADGRTYACGYVTEPAGGGPLPEVNAVIVASPAEFAATHAVTIPGWSVYLDVTAEDGDHAYETRVVAGPVEAAALVMAAYNGTGADGIAAVMEAGGEQMF